MKKQILIRVLSGLFAVLGLTAAALGIWLGLNSVDAAPVLLREPEAVPERVEQMLELVSAGDYNGAGKLMQGQPDFGADREAADEAGRILWDAFVSGFSYRLEGECYATDSGVAQDVVITRLEPDSVTAGLRDRIRSVLEKRLETAEDVSEVYDENNNFREEVVAEALLEALKEAIREDASYTGVTVTVTLVWRDGSWWIVPEEGLIRAITGGIVS